MKVDSTKKYFTIKELYQDTTRSEIIFLNKRLKRILELKKAETPPKITIPGEAWPSNQWPIWSSAYASAFLIAFRKASGDKETLEDAIKYIEEKRIY